MVTTIFSEQDIVRVTAAVTEAEAATDGEIVTIVTASSDGYQDIALLWSALVMFLALAVIAAWPDFYLRLLDKLWPGWHPVWTPRELLAMLFAVLALKFLGTRLILTWDRLRIALTPRVVKAHRVRQRAIACFKVGAEKRTLGRTGILIYLSLAEHRAEIVADEALHGKVTPETWGEAMTALIDGVRADRPGEGMAAAVACAGRVLAEHLPKSSSDTNELPDRLILL
jgi:putative membrane protein